MEIEFDFRKEKSGLFGLIQRPVAKVTLISKKNTVPEIFYVDSGADITLLPLSVGELLGFTNPTPSEITEIRGIGEKGVPIVLRSVIMILGNLKLRSRVGWALIEDVPLLLGREDFFRHFDILFKRNRKTVFIA